MSKLEAKEFTSAVGRLVGGSVHEPITEDFDGKPLTVKTGKRKGEETQRFSFGVAFAKVPGQHWATLNEMCALIWATGHEHMGALAQRKDFSWKITDGDSTEVNKKNNRPCDNEGFPGHWVVWFSSSFAPDTYDAIGGKEPVAIDPEIIEKGFYVQVRGSVVGNGNETNPGVFINHGMVALVGYGQVIESKNKPDPKKAGFGQGVQLPAGASTAPPAGLKTPGTPSAPPAPNAAPPAPPAPAAPLPTTAVAPAPGFVAPPPVAAAPPPPPATVAAPPPPPAGPVWKGPPGTTYDAYKAGGWSDDQMRTAGLLV